jgi:hypothetical protein
LAPAGPVVLALAPGEHQRWLLQTKLSQPAHGGTALAAFIDSPWLEQLIAPRTFGKTPPGALGPDGTLQARGAEPPWQLSWGSESELTRWALGVDAEAWLGSGAPVNAVRLFPSWAGLCEGEPVFGLGLVRGSTVIDLALARRGKALRIEGRIPTPDLVEWAGVAGGF